MPVRRGTNPFYILLVLAGIAFTVTASAYGVMTVRGLRPASRTTAPADQGLLDFLDHHGGKLMLAELAVLGGATVLAIGSDGFWSHRETGPASQPTTASPATSPHKETSG